MKNTVLFRLLGAAVIGLGGLLPGRAQGLQRHTSFVQPADWFEVLGGAAAPAGTAAYCTTGLGGGSCDIAQVAIQGTTLLTAASSCPGTPTNNYSSYPASGSTTATLVKGQTYTFSVTTTTNSIVSIWLDSNLDGFFSGSEWTQISTFTTVGVSTGATFTVPFTAVSGTTGLRVRTRGTGNGNGPADACTSFGSGETRDYAVTIVNSLAANDNCSSATSLAVNTTCNPIPGTTVTASPSTAGTSSCGTSNGNDVWYRVVVPAGMTVLNVQTSAGTTAPQLTDTVLELYRGTCNSLTSIGCNDDIVAGNNFSLVTANVTPGETIYARVLPFQVTPDGSFQVCAFGNFTPGNNTVAAPYCDAPHTSGCGNGTITNVTLSNTTLDNTSTCSVNAAGYPYYNYPASGTTTGTVRPGSNYFLNVSALTGQSISAWVDWNQNQLFDASEWVQVTTNLMATTAAVQLVVPATALAGNTRLRIRSRAAGSPNGSTDACSNFGSGETEDYTLTVQAVGNTTVAAPYCDAPHTSGCGNGTITNVTLTNTALNNTSTCSVNAAGYPYYNYPASGTTTGNVQAGGNYFLYVSADAGQSVSAWVDWNQNRVFDANEWLQVATNMMAPSANLQLVVPASAVAGNTRLRIRTRAANSSNTSTDACSQFGSGETEDYTLLVTAVGNTTSAAPFCAPTSTAPCGGSGSITNVTLANTTLNNSSGCSQNASGYPYYNYPAAGSATGTVLPGSTYALSVTTDDMSIVSAWVDWNRNLLFDASEWVQVTTSSTAGAPATVNLTVPTSITTSGQVRLRIRTRATGAANGSTDACTQFGSGEAEDYTLNVSTCTPPNAPATAGASRCGAGTVTLTASGAAAGNSYRWYTQATGGTAIAGATGASYTTPSLSTTTTYYASIVGSCESTRTAAVATVGQQPVANAGSDVVTCSNVAAQLGAAPVAGTTYSWSPSTGLSNPAVANPTVQLTNTSSTTSINAYTLTATIGGCSATSTVTVSVNPGAVAAAGPSVDLCSGTPAVLGTPAVAGVNYSWSPAAGLNDPTLAQPTVALSTAGTTPVSTTYTLTASRGACTSTSTVVVTVKPVPPTPSISQAGSVLTSSASSGNQWYLNGGAIAGATSNVYTVFGPGRYTVVVGTGNGCFSAASAQVVVTGSRTALPGTSLSVVPNPVSSLDGALTVTLTGYHQATELALVNALGQVVLRRSLTAAEAAQPQRLALHGLATGMYVLRATTAGGTDTRRVLLR